ncbi:uncharacterized protein BKA78DRAFT_18271 [Phyllosticta capitalensis]|uniref:uncharacterized protein n=1 Tax=Phyllosticta capitalensis TaxID=121624 RepID=UPI00312E1956
MHSVICLVVTKGKEIPNGKLDCKEAFELSPAGYSLFPPYWRSWCMRALFTQTRLPLQLRKQKHIQINNQQLEACESALSMSKMRLGTHVLYPLFPFLFWCCDSVPRPQSERVQQENDWMLTGRGVSWGVGSVFKEVQLGQTRGNGGKERCNKRNEGGEGRMR